MAQSQRLGDEEDLSGRVSRHLLAEHASEVRPP